MALLISFLALKLLFIAWLVARRQWARAGLAHKDCRLQADTPSGCSPFGSTAEGSALLIKRLAEDGPWLLGPLALLVLVLAFMPPLRRR